MFNALEILFYAVPNLNHYRNLTENISINLVIQHVFEMFTLILSVFYLSS